MKATITILICVGIGVTLFIPKGVTSQSLDHDVTILYDRTDEHHASPSYENVQQFLGLTEQPNQGIQLTYATITDLAHNPIQTFTLKQASFWWTNEFDRQDDLNSFNSFLESITTDTTDVGNTRSHSAIYGPLVKLLNTLASSTAKQKSFIIYSDLVENDQISFYDPNVRSKLSKTPEEIQTALENQGRFGNLTGIDVYLVYQPANREEDSTWSLVSSFYERLLSQRGANIHIVTSLPIIR